MMKNNKKKRRHGADDIKIDVVARPIENDGVLITPSQQKMVQCVEFLGERANDILAARDKIADNGWGLAINENEEFVLAPHGNPAFASFWPSVAYAFNADYNKVKSAPTFITNTQDLGFVHVAPTADKSDTEILGPVINPCLIGSINSPAGILIPFAGGEEALRAGRVMIDSFLNTKKQNAIACDCNGECDCDGTCGDNCKCHTEDHETKMSCTGSERMW